MTNTYDHITNQFSRDLSPLARRMYAVIYEATGKAGATIYIASLDIDKALGEDTGLDVRWRSQGSAAMFELLKVYLVREVPKLSCRYELTSYAWRAHLLAERSLKEQAFRALESTERALARCIDESDAAALLRDAVEGRR